MHVSVLGNPDDSIVVTVRGSLDLTGAPVLATTLDQVLERPVPRIVVDVAEVGFCDSAGLGALVAGLRRAERGGGWLRLTGAGPALARLLGSAGLREEFPLFPSVAEALAAPRDG